MIKDKNIKKAINLLLEDGRFAIIGSDAVFESKINYGSYIDSKGSHEIITGTILKVGMNNGKGVGIMPRSNKKEGGTAFLSKISEKVLKND
ncbi:hypothetical protein M0R19_05330 [Candidatus Pacearchaeota archaeon]|jgi:hypothetical protein|nr:hypothetical protein [Candidatus Pacearchaeota archaeon]